MEIDHVYEKLKMAINTLAASTHRIQERLWEAWLIIHTVNIEDFPPELRDDFRKLSDAMMPQQSAVNADPGRRVGYRSLSSNQLNDHQARQLVLLIVQLFAETSAQFWPTHKKWNRERQSNAADNINS
jgi:hypothetical protein